MEIKNPWVGYLNRSYTTIKASVLNRLRTLAPEITDYSEGNPLVILVSIYSGIAEQLNYYIDAMARELFLPTARKYPSVVKISQLVNYRVRASISASVDLTFTLLNGDGEPAPVVSTPVVIPINTPISTASGIQFLTLVEREIKPGFYNVSIPARQREIVSLYSLGTSSGLANQEIALPQDFEDGTLYLEVAGSVWDYKEHLGFSWGDSPHFTVVVKENGIPYITFGDNLNGKIPPAGNSIAVAYRTTLGVRGNIPANTLTEGANAITIPVGETQISEITVTNINTSIGGLDPEGIERLRKSIPLSIRTLDRAVTEQDYNDIAKLSPSVDKAKVFFNCGKKVTVYVAPIGGGIASSSMLADVLAFMNVRKMITTFIEVEPAGETFIGLDIVASARFRVNTQLTLGDIGRALVEAYSSDNSDINKPVRLSDIYSVLDNLERVDYLKLVKVFWVPYARPQGHTVQLDWTRKTLDNSTNTLWQIVYNGTTFQLFRSGVFISNLTIGVLFTYGNAIEITINSLPAGVVSGNRWIFETHPSNTDLELTDYTVPRISPDLSYVSITVNEGNG